MWYHEKIMMRAGDEERTINYEWPKVTLPHLSFVKESDQN